MSKRQDMTDYDNLCENTFGLISGYYIYHVHRLSIIAGSNWDYKRPETMEIIVTKENAAEMYAFCKAIRSGYDVGLKRSRIAKIKAARQEAHRFLVAEANDPNTSIDRKIQLTRLTSKTP